MVKRTPLILPLLISLVCGGAAILSQSAEEQAPVGEPASQTEVAEYGELRGHWISFVESYGKDTDARAALLHAGEPALEVMLDLLYGPKQQELDVKRIEELVKQLGAPKFRQRQTAQSELESMGYDIVRELQPHTGHDNPEIVARLREIMLHAQKLAPDAKLKRAALNCCTEILEVSWPVGEIRNVARRNLERLSRIESVAYHWGSRPLGPLLGSLRHSDQLSDRKLLEEFARSASDGASEVALELMLSGLTGRTRHNIARHWRSLPTHDYSEEIWPLLDPSRPGVFRKAMYVAPRGKELQSVLHDALPNVEDAELKKNIYLFLWHYLSDPIARDHYIEALDSPDFSTFSTAVYRLTDSKFSYMGAEIIPSLRPALQEGEEKRRKLVLGRLGNYIGEPSVRLAAMEAAPFLVSEDPEDQMIARRVLMGLQRSGRVDVLGLIATEHESEKVRAAAQKLHESWGDSKSSKK